MTVHDRFTDDVGAYLLGALEDDETRAFEEHLDGCGACREELVRLEVGRDALPRAVDQVAPPERLKATLMETVRAEAADAEPSRSRERRPRWRWRELLLTRPRYAAAAAAVLIAVGVAAGALVGALGGGDDSASTVAAQVDASRMPAGKASLVVPQGADDKGGAILRVQGMQQPQAGHVYEVWVKRGDKVTPSSLFTVHGDGSGAAAIPDKLRGADAVLVTREPDGGSKTPSEPPVVTVPLRS